jgi:transcriptional regulator with XRE-family HTH domain
VAQTANTQFARIHASLLLAMSLDPHEIGQRIRQARDRKGWTQLQFALEANVSPSTVARWESGRLPPIRELMRIAVVLGIPAEELVERPPNGAMDPATLAAALEEVVGLRGEVRTLTALIQELLEGRAQEPPGTHQAP